MLINRENWWSLFCKWPLSRSLSFPRCWNIAVASYNDFPFPATASGCTICLYLWFKSRLLNPPSGFKPNVVAAYHTCIVAQSPHTGHLVWHHLEYHSTLDLQQDLPHPDEHVPPPMVLLHLHHILFIIWWAATCIVPHPSFWRQIITIFGWMVVIGIIERVIIALIALFFL